MPFEMSNALSTFMSDDTCFKAFYKKISYCLFKEEHLNSYPLSKGSFLSCPLEFFFKDFIVFDQGTSANLDKVKAIRDWTTSKILTKVWF